ncbi:MAG TPA: prepilin-type N-terminal cleavage/methylation domain-containing protein [Candidatus Omnitrophota bacterium]|nr:prepilin-type N-terminal cleavage/methylation domain-containing protein [Candidatus Omnitrophota bacterium]HPS37421.1 prepilin-type N-terminal cleavage/methylation domain-containing protein [Candidatus Omnitrophota bacterium]
MNKRGFTLIELIMVIVLLGLLAVVAIPKYYDLQTDAKTAAEQGVVGGVRSGIYTYFAKNKAYPATLDSASNGACSKTNKCFTTVLDQDGIQQDWTKTATGYTGPANGAYVYNSTTGSFTD